MRFRQPSTAPEQTRLPGSAAVIGALGSILLHLTIFGVIFYGPRGAHPLQHHSGIGATALSHDDIPVGTLILIEASAATAHSADDNDELGSLGQLLQSPLLTIASPTVTRPNFDFLDDLKTDSTQSSESTGDQRGQAALFGLYMRQIQARIERAWQRPATAPSTGEFTCHVQITQSKRGDVEEIQLLTCTDSLPWRLSLVSAIQTASPLPAPPDLRVFSDLLRLSFHTEAAPNVSFPAVADPHRESAPEGRRITAPRTTDSLPSNPAAVHTRRPSIGRLHP